MEDLGRDAATVRERTAPGGGFPGMTVKGAFFDKRADAADAFRSALVACAEAPGEAQDVGTIMGLDVSASFRAASGCFLVTVGHAPSMTFEGADGGVGAVTRIENEAKRIEQYASKAAERLERSKAELAASKESLGKAFPQQRRLLEVKKRLAELDAKIGEKGHDPSLAVATESGELGDGQLSLEDSGLVLFDRAELVVVNRGIDKGWDVSVYAFDGLDSDAMERASYFATPIIGVGVDRPGMDWGEEARAVESGERPFGPDDVRDAVRESVKHIAAQSERLGLDPSDQCMLVDLAGSVALHGGRPLSLVKQIAAMRGASAQQRNGIGYYGLVRKVRDVALAALDAGGDFAAAGIEAADAILSAKMPSARVAWSVASDIAERAAATAAKGGERCPAEHLLASGKDGAVRTAPLSRGEGR